MVLEAGARGARNQKLLRAVLLGGVLLPQPALAETTLRPFVELRQTTRWSSPGDFGAHASTAAGVIGSVNTQRVDANLGYTASRRFGIYDSGTSGWRHNGSASIGAELLRDYLYFDGNAQARFTNTGFSGLINPDSDDRSQRQVYSVSAQPSFRHVFLNRVAVEARYRYGLVETEGGGGPLLIGSPFNPTRLLSGGASDSRSQSASASIGNVGWSSRVRIRGIADWQRDRIEQLNTHFDSKRAIGDIEIGLTRDFSLLGSGGYEDVKSEQDAILLDPVTGLPIPDLLGRLQIDPLDPRRVTFEYTGPTYDGGFRWSPTRRTNFFARAGKRYGNFTASGALSYQLSSVSRISASYSESINNFGRLLTTLFTDPVTGEVALVRSRAGGGRSTPVGSSTCAAGFDPLTRTCLFNLTQIATSAVFKNRTARIGYQKGNEEFEGTRFFGQASLFYNRRSYLGPGDETAPNIPVINPAFGLGGTRDISYGVRAGAQQLLGSNRFITADAEVRRNRYALSGTRPDVRASLHGTYAMLLDRQIIASASAFATHRFSGGTTSPLIIRGGGGDRTEATFTLSLRYSFAPVTGRFTPAEFETGRNF